MANIKDVAKLAGVSAMTVSNVINGSVAVTPETKDKVMAAISELGYRPNGVARSLRYKRSNTIGVIIPDASNLFYAEVLKGIEAAARAKGYSTLFCDSGYDVGVEADALEMLLGKQIDGVILASVAWAANCYERLSSIRRPVVLADIVPEGCTLPSVASDNFGGAYAATVHLADKGYRMMGFIGEPSGIPAAKARLDGYLSAMHDLGMGYDGSLVKIDERLKTDKVGWGYEVMREVLRDITPPLGIVTSSDLIAIGALKAVTASKYSIPSDIAIVGFDDILLASYTEPGLTTVSQEKLEMGRTAADVLIGLIEGTLEPKRWPIILPTHVVMRGTT